MFMKKESGRAVALRETNSRYEEEGQYVQKKYKEESRAKLECVRELDPEIMMYYLSFVSMVHEFKLFNSQTKGIDNAIIGCYL